MKLLLLLLPVASLLIVVVSAASGESFHESLLLKPLPDRNVLAHFHFRTVSPHNTPHHHLFPKAISQLISKFSIRQLELSFTQGRWNYHRWGSADPVPAANAKPPGVELHTAFSLPAHAIDPTWKDLTHALSGLFCSSLNFLESSAAYVSPDWSLGDDSRNSRYGALPREAVCTENLTPWLKLLPCRDKAGIASLLDRASVYQALYHSQRLRLVSDGSDGIVVEQTLTVVIRPDERWSGRELQPDWSVGSLFKRGVSWRCVVAESSSVFVEIERGLVEEMEKVWPGGAWNGSVFELSRAPDGMVRSGRGSVLYEFDVVNNGNSEVMDVGFSWRRPVAWSCSRVPLRVERFLMGSGNERGSIAIRLMPTKKRERLDGDGEGDQCVIDVAILQIVPWYVKVYYHTLKVIVDGEARVVSSVVEKLKVSPSEDKLSPGVMELMLRLPCDMKLAVLTIDFDKGFLHIDEYPPDANQGFDIPSAVVSFPNFTVSRNLFEGSSVEKHFLPHGFEDRNPVRSYTEILLVPLTTPDFSMPYNVITFTCTVLALYFGSLLNVLRRRIGEEERLLSNAASRQGLLPQLLSKLISKVRRETPESSGPSASHSGSKQLLKVILVVLAAVLWYHFQNE